MSEKSLELPLFAEFPPVSTQDWEKAIQKDLKGADYEKKLVWQTLEGFKVRPYYREENIKDYKFNHTLPGEFPFVRGNNKTSNGWYIRQDIHVKNMVQANKEALEILMKGVDSLNFIFGKEIEIEETTLDRLLAGVSIESIELNFESRRLSKELLELLVSFISKNKLNVKQIRGSVDFDPIGSLTIYGSFCKSEEYSYNKVKTMYELSRELTDFHVLGVRGDYFKNAGSTIVQELAFSLAAGAENISRLVDMGLTVDEIASKMKFTFSVGTNYFMEIAKIRAARLLWSKITEGFGLKNLENARMNIHSVTCSWNKTLYDSYVNLLRTTTEAMSASIAGTTSLTVNPFDNAYQKPSEFSNRIARNQQNVLKEESYFDKIIDPAGGSYYIETLTQSIAEQAWDLFLKIQDKGGYIQAFKVDFIQNEIKTVANKRDQNITSRRENILGVNQFPNFKEIIEHEIDATVFEPADFTKENSIAETLKPYRGAQAIELIRYKTDLYAKKNIRPKVFMFTYGNLAMRVARSQFSSNFFGCAGFEVIDNNGFPTIDQGVKSALENSASIVVVCSSDEEYSTIVPEIYEKIKGKSILVVAGAPACTEELKQKGINNFIHVKSNLLDTLKYYQKELGIE
jgi:methylmalonyl-CoA mutase